MNNKTWLIALCGIVVLPLIPFLFGRFFAIGDMRDVFIPIETFFRSKQIIGEIPSWDSSVSFGFPIIASAQIGFFYPGLFLFRFLPIWLELPLVIAFHLCACAIGTFLFARRLKISKEGSLFTALSFTLSQFIWQHVTHLNIFLAIAWLPWQLLAVHTIFQKKKISTKDIVILIALFGTPFFIGQIQIPFLIMLVSLTYGLCLRPQKSIRGTGIPVILILTGTFFLSAAQLFPTAELAVLSSRGTSDGFNIVRANQHSYPLYHIPTIIFPRFYGNDNTYWGKRLEIEYGSYIGVIPLIFASWFLFQKRPNNDISITFFYWLGGVSFLLALGSLSPFRIIGIEPSLWIFSAPARWLLFTTLSASIFAGMALDSLRSHTSQIQKFVRLASIGIIGIIVAGNVALFFSDHVISLLSNTNSISLKGIEKISLLFTSAQTSSVSLASPFLYIPLFIALALPFIISLKHAVQIILIITALDLILIAGFTTPTIPWKDILSVPATIQKLPETVTTHNARIYSVRDGGDTGAYFTNPESRANNQTRILQKNLLVPMVSSQFGIYGVEWPASLDIAEQGAALEKLHPTKPYSIEDTSLAQELTIGALLSPGEGTNAVVTTLPSKPRAERIDGTAKIISDTSSEVTIETFAEKPSKLILRDTFYPGWRAYSNGIELPIIKSPLFFRSVEMPAGDQIVRFIYRPIPLYAGAISTLLILTICVIVARRTRV